jgi:hypothetical protein
MKYRHDPTEPLPVICRMSERVGASGRKYLYGFGENSKFLLFPNDDGSWNLCAQPLSRADRTTIPEIPLVPTQRELAHQEALRRLEEPVGFVSGLPRRWP